MSFPQLSEPDVRAMVRLLVEVSVSRGGALEKKRLLMDGLVKLISADSWMWGFYPEVIQGQRPVPAVLIHGGFEQERFSRFVTAASHPVSESLAQQALDLSSGQRSHFTRSCRQLSHDCTRHGEIAELWKDADIGEVLLSQRWLDCGGFSHISIFRRHGVKDFTARETRIAHILLTEVAWLHESGWTEAQAIHAPKLSPRRRTVLHLVLEGRSRKDMAQELGISIHTLDGYVKDIFRHFNAHSQAELIARFRSGDGHDTPRSGD